MLRQIIRTLTVFAITSAGLLLIAQAGTPNRAEAAHVTCGQTILVSTTLDADLTCPGPGLIIGADNLTLDLGGHTITGSGTFDGVAIDSGRHGITVRNGTVTGFAFGIRLSGADHNTIDRIRAMNSVLNGISLFRDGSGNGSDWNTVQDCAVSGAGSFGVILNNGSDDNTVQRCDITGTGGSGIFIGGGGTAASPSFRNRIEGNVVHDGSTTSGPAISIFGGSGSNTVIDNQVLRNGAVTVGHGIAISQSSNDNTVLRNTVTGSAAHGIQVSSGSTRNTIERNQISWATREGIALNAPANIVTTNRVETSNRGVFFGTGANGNIVSSNLVVNNRGAGFEASTTSADLTPNVISDNVAYANGTSASTPLDVNDLTTGGGTSGTRNTYARNYCLVGSPAALCVPQPASVATSATPGGANVPLGSSATDTATVSGGGPTPTGTVKFFLCQPSEVTAGGCEGTAGTQIGTPSTGETLVTGVATSDSTTSTATVGKYCWRAEYSGNAFYFPATHTNATTECFTAVATLRSLTALVNSLVADGSITTNPTGLLAKLADAQDALDKGKPNVAVHKLQDFINQVEAQTGKGITIDAAALLIQQANHVIASLS